MAMTFIKLPQAVLISWAKENMSVITKFGSFVNYTSLLEIHSVHSHLKSSENSCAVEIRLFFIQCLSNTVDNRILWLRKSYELPVDTP